MRMQPTAQDVFNPDKKARDEALFGQYGMDSGGDNEAGAWGRRNEQLMGAGLTRANDFSLNFLEPGRQANLTNLMAYLQPGNTAERVKRQAQLIATRGAQLGNKQASMAGGQGFSPEYQAALRQMFAGKAQRQGNEYMGTTDEQTAQNSMALNQIIQQGQNNPFLPQFLALAQLIEGRSGQNKADQAQGGFGGILGSIGQIAGMFPGAQWANMFGGGGGGGQGGGARPGWMSRLGHYF